MKKRVLTILLALVMAAVFVPVADKGDYTYASTNGHTQDEAVAWAKGMADAHTYCGECVALIMKYYDWLGVSVPYTNANTFANADHIPSGWYVDNTPSLGSVYVESNYSPGHVSIVVGIDSAGTLTTVDSNVTGSSVGQYNAQYFPWTTGRKKSDYAGVAGKSFVHPNFASSPTLSGCPQVSVDAGYYKLQYADCNRYLNVVSNLTDNGTNVDIWSSVGHDGQTFYIDWNGARTGQYIQHRTSGKFIDTGGNVAGNCNVIIWEGNGADGQQWIFEDAGNGYVYIRNLYGYYLDVSGGGTNEGANVQTWEFNGSRAQKWKLVKVSGKDMCNIESGCYMLQCKVGKWLDVSGAGTDNGVNIQLWGSDGDAQKFNIGWNDYIKGYYICNTRSGKFIDTAGNNYVENVIQYDGTGAEGQNWIIENAGDGYYYIRNLWGGYLDAQNGSNANGTNVQTYYFNGSDAQKWRVVRVSTADKISIKEGKYKIQSKSGSYVDVSGAKTTNGTNIQLWDSTGEAQDFNIAWNNDLKGYCISNTKSGKLINTAGNSYTNNVIQYEKTGAEGQYWIFENAGGGYYYIRNLWGGYLDVDNNGTANGTNIQTWGFNGTNAQKWKLVHAHTLVRTSAKAATTTSEGNIEYWTCSSCGKIFKDSAGTTEISKADTVIPKLSSSDASSSDTASIKTDLPAVKIAKPKAAKKAVTVKWKKVSKTNQNKISKIQIQISQDKTFKTGVKTVYAKKSAASKKIKKLTSKKKYYVRVRAYKKSGGVTHVSKWSAVKAVKVK